jgi:serine/threonine protein kinase
MPAPAERTTAVDPILSPGRFVIVKELGRGGMSVVYQARDTLQDRHVALKVCPLDLVAGHDTILADSTIQRLLRFRREASFAGLVHPNVIRIYDFGVWEDEGKRCFSIVQELVEGVSLADALLDPSPPAGPDRSAARARLLRDFMRICEGVAYAHETGCVHRDLKPANILLVPDYTRARVLDWGLAKWLGRADLAAAAASPGSDPFLSMDGAIMGTPNYMPPEQATGALDRVGPPSDVWSLGIVLFEILTRWTPFEGGTTTEILDRVATQTAPSPNEYLATHPPARDQADPVPAALEAIVNRCLRRDPSERYADARGLLGDLEAWISSPQGALDLLPPAGRRRYAAGEIIAREGEPSTTMFVLERGCGTVVIEKAGWSQACAEGFFGEAALVKPGQPRTATLRAGDAGCELIVVSDETALLRLLHESPLIGVEAIKELHSRRVQAENWYVKQIEELRKSNEKSQ